MLSPDLLTRVANASTTEWATVVCGALALYASLRCLYLLYFHPASKFPGPKLAAVSNVWYAYHWMTGRWPWAIEDVMNKYGNIVRIAPNELAFITPEAAHDIYSSNGRSMETFVKTDFTDVSQGDDGITWERDPVRHRQVAKKIAPAFSNNSVRAKEPTMHKHIDYFISKMKVLAESESDVELKKWVNWLAMDLSADLAYNRQMNQLRDEKNSLFLDALWGTNLFMTVSQVLKRFPLLAPVKFLFVPPQVLRSLPKLIKMNKDEVQSRISRRGNTEHLDYFEHICPAGGAEPPKSELVHMEVMAGQLIVAGYSPVSGLLYNTILLSLLEPESYKKLVKEIRDEFSTYDSINPEALASLKYLHASLMETLRMSVLGANGLPRISPGAVVDGAYIDKGIVCQYGHFAFSRSPKYFHEPRSYRPQRWLPADHPLYDNAFINDETRYHYPFSLGPRSCPGLGAAWKQARLFVAKLLWTFDLEMLPGQNIDFDKDFKHYTMWTKPELRVRLHQVQREEA